MSLLQSLGIDNTVILQFIIAAFSLAVLSAFVFSPFQKAYSERIKNTDGNVADSEEVLEKIQILKLNYESRLKELNKEINNIFEDQKKIALSEQIKTLEEIRKQIERNKSNFEDQLIKVRAKYEADKENMVSALSLQIFDRLISKG